MAIWRDLVDDHGFPAQYASVRRFVGRLRGQRTPEAHPVIVTAPGEEGQVDYGDGPMVLVPLHGDLPPEPAGRRRVVGPGHFDTAVPVHAVRAVLGVAKVLVPPPPYRRA